MVTHTPRIHGDRRAKPLYMEEKYGSKKISRVFSNIRKDYWFIDPINYAPAVEKIRFQFEYDDPIMTAAYAFRLDVTTEVAEFQGSIPIELNAHSQKCIYEIEHPKADVFYVIIIEGNSKEEER